MSKYTLYIYIHRISDSMRESENERKRERERERERETESETESEKESETERERDVTRVVSTQDDHHYLSNSDGGEGRGYGPDDCLVRRVLGDLCN